MRLHTNFHDYYDKSIGYGIDENVHYNRVTKAADICIKARANLPTYRECGLLGFCGQIFPFVEMNKYTWTSNSDHSRTEGKIVERYYAYSTEDYVRKQNEWYMHQKNYSFGYYDLSRHLGLPQFFTDWSFQSNDVFIEFGVPAWIFGFHKQRINGVINPRLKDYGFDRIKDSVSAFQEISMYLSNILVEQKEIVQIDDKLRIEQQGFDLKTSFRKGKKSKAV